MDEKLLKDRFMRFAMSIVTLVSKFPRTKIYFIIEDQILRCSSGSAAGYRAACRARSRPDFIYKLGNVEEEMDESLFWLEYTINVDKKWDAEIRHIYAEGDELLSIIVSSINTSKSRLNNSKTPFKKGSP